MWRGAKLTDEQIELLQNERRRHPKGKLRPPDYRGPCGMFVEPNICLTHKLLGPKFKPADCEGFGRKNKECNHYECERFNADD